MTSDNDDVLTSKISDITKERYEQTIKDGTGYEPSVPIKRSYLPLRKKDRLWGGVNYPGLFDYDTAHDAEWFWFTVALEVVSLGVTYFLLKERISELALLIGALCVFFLDFALAYFHHLSKGIICLIENQKRLFLPEMRSGIMDGPFANYAAHLEQRLKDNLARKFVKPLSAVLIWIASIIKGGVFLIAVLSSYWFQVAVSESKTPYLLIVVITASYLWIAYNHLIYTGYFLAGISHKRQYSAESADYYRKVGAQRGINEKQYKEEKIDLKDFLDRVSSDNTNPYLVHFIRKAPKDLEKSLPKGLKDIQVQAHGIHKVPDGEFLYVIYRFGLLTDDHLQKMVDVQETQLAQLAVATYGHKLQMQSGHFDAN